MPWLLAQANALRIPLPDASVHCCVTSPPYFSLRDYGVAGQLGLEPTPEAYVARMVEVFREVRRVMRSDATLWLNLGDTFAGGGKGGGGSFESDRPGWTKRGREPIAPGLKPKDLVGIPWRVAFALQADGWYLRSDIIWSKANPMPESVTDRPTKSHEYVFLMSKRPTYYFDAEAVKENLSGSQCWGAKRKSTVPGPTGQHTISRKGQDLRKNITHRNIRTVWTIPTRAYPGAHFATFPPRLVEPCIKAGTSERGCCPECGAPWKRDVEREPMVIARSGRGEALGKFGATAASGMMVSPARCSTVGWSPTCSHALDPVPCRVLDPFAGSGTTLVVAEALGRHGIGLDISRKYLTKQAKRRLERPHARAIRPTQTEPELPLFR